MPFTGLKRLLCLLTHVCVKHSALSAPSALDGLVIRNEPGTWFSLEASMPVVLRVSAQDYRMWTYGRELNFSQYNGSIFGRSGYFTSMDGLHWQSVSGDGILGSVLDPRRGTNYFDGGALGFTDVKYADGTFYAWYQAQPDATLANTTDNSTFNLRAGVAVSHDGIHWSHCDGSAQAEGALLDITPGIDNIIFGPHIFDFSNASAMDNATGSFPPANISLPAPSCSQLAPIQGNFTMLYHSLEFTGRTTFLQLTAKSTDLLHFNKTGPLIGISPSTDNTSFDYVGAADGRIVQTPSGYLYFYEGTSLDFSYAIGLARSIDGVHFVKDTSCTGAPGGPVFRPSANASAFDAKDIGTPFPLLQPNGEIWLYYVGFGLQPVLPGATPNEGTLASQIGLAMSVPNAAGKQDYCNFVRAPPVFDAPASYDV